MRTLTIEVSGISDETMSRLDKRAEACGTDRSQIILEIIEAGLKDTQSAAHELTFAEIVAPLQQDFEASGMSEDELGEFIDSEIQAYRRERKALAQQAGG